MGDVTAAEVRSVLEDVDFPASKEALLDAAFRAGAGSDVLDALRALPMEDYGNVDQVVRSVETAEATGQSPADKAVRARERAHPELAEHMRDRQAPRLDRDPEE